MIQPDRVVDAHVHLWQPSRHHWYPGLRAFADQLDRPDLYGDFGLVDYREAAGDLPVTGLVHVSAVTEPRAYLYEAGWVEALADAEGLDLVFIGTVDPTLPEAALVGDLEEQARSPRFRGVRVLQGLEPGSSAARTVLDWLEQRDLVFDLVTSPAQMVDWIVELHRHPDLRVVLEHTGWPAGVGTEDRAAWREAVTACAAQTAAACKVSGLGMVTGDLSEPALRPWVECAIEAFGWDRVLFGSNIPIERMAGEYAALRGSLDAILAEAAPGERSRFWADNAERVYRL